MKAADIDLIRLMISRVTGWLSFSVPLKSLVASQKTAQAGSLASGFKANLISMCVECKILLPETERRTRMVAFSAKKIVTFWVSSCSSAVIQSPRISQRSLRAVTCLVLSLLVSVEHCEVYDFDRQNVILKASSH